MKCPSIIKFLLPSIAILGVSFLAKAEQDPYFATFNNLEPYFPWLGDGVDSHRVGETPEGWNVANVGGIPMFTWWYGASEVATYNDFYSEGLVTLGNKTSFGQLITGYMSLGTTWCTGEIYEDFPDPTSVDGGSFGGIKIDEQPIAIRITYKATSNDAQLIAYTWEGDWISEKVTSSVYLAGPTYCNMKNRDRCVLGKEKPVKYGQEREEEALLLSRLETNLEQSDDLITQTFYLDNVGYPTGAQKYLNIIVSAGTYFCKPSEIKRDLSISVKEIALVYEHDYNSVIPENATNATIVGNQDDAQLMGYYNMVSKCVTPSQPSNGLYITLYKLSDGSIKRILSE